MSKPTCNPEIRISFWALALAAATIQAAPAADRQGNRSDLETRIKHISDADLFAALDLNRPALALVKNAVNTGDYPAAYRAWAGYWTGKDKITLGHYGDPELDGELLAAAEVEARLRADPTQSKSWIQRAEPVMRHEITGWGNVTHQHGEVVDFNFDYGWNGKVTCRSPTTVRVICWCCFGPPA